MARAGGSRLSQTLPNLIKGTAVIGACSYQTQQARTFHDPESAASNASTGLVATSATTTPTHTKDDTHTHTHEDAYERRVLLGKGGSSTVSEVVGLAMRSVGSDSPMRHSISAREVQEASRILFTPAASARRPPSPHHMPPRHPGSGRASDLEPRPHTPTTIPSAAAVGGVEGVAAAAPSTPTRHSHSHSHSDNHSIRLHPRPAVNEEILRFGMQLASDPRIQSVIRETLHHQHNASPAIGEGEGSVEGEELDAASSSSSSWPSSSNSSGGSTGEARPMGGSEGPTPSSSASHSLFSLGESFELLLEEAAPSILAWGHSNTSTRDQEEVEEEEEEVMRAMGGSLMALGRSMRTRDAILSAPPPSCTTPVNEEILDELLRADEDDPITSRMFAHTPEAHVRQYLRELECVICHEFMVEATALDCGEGHIFCRECIERWLEVHSVCPTCVAPVSCLIPMRQYDAMIDKHVRASCLYDEMRSYYQRKTLAQVRKEAAAHAQSSSSSSSPQAHLHNSSTSRRGPQRRRSRVLDESNNGSNGSGGNRPWWRSEALSTALSVAAMLILAVLFKRATAPKPR